MYAIFCSLEKVSTFINTHFDQIITYSEIMFIHNIISGHHVLVDEICNRIPYIPYTHIFNNKIETSARFYCETSSQNFVNI